MSVSREQIPSLTQHIGLHFNGTGHMYKWKHKHKTQRQTQVQTVWESTYSGYIDLINWKGRPSGILRVVVDDITSKNHTLF